MAYYETGAATLAVSVCLGVLVFTFLKQNPRLQSVYRQWIVPQLSIRINYNGTWSKVLSVVNKSFARTCLS